MLMKANPTIEILETNRCHDKAMYENNQKKKLIFKTPHRRSSALGGLVRSAIGFFASNAENQMDAVLVDLTGRVAMERPQLSLIGCFNHTLTMFCSCSFLFFENQKI